MPGRPEKAGEPNAPRALPGLLRRSYLVRWLTSPLFLLSLCLPWVTMTPTGCLGIDPIGATRTYSGWELMWQLPALSLGAILFLSGIFLVVRRSGAILVLSLLEVGIGIARRSRMGPE